MMRDDTIFALSSAPGRAGVALFRVSGPQAGAAVRALTGQGPPHPRRAALRAFVDGKGRAIDHGLLLWFPGPASFTGEDCAEFHAHGGRAIADGLMEALGAVPGLRPAEAGEFTRRAVENGKLDLTRAEALADLIDAETESQRRQALRQYGGAAEALYEDWRTRLIAAGALAEAAIDFAEEELPEDVETRARENLTAIQAEIAAYLNDAGRGELIRDGVHLTVIGPPNAGKSSLINALAKRSVAIVSDIPGTTRDVIDIRLDLGGYLVTISDTAGLRESGDAIEREGVRRARARAAESDLVLLLLDGASSDQPELGDLKPDLIVWNKTDLPWPAARDGLHLSLKTGAGVEALLAWLTRLVARTLERPGEAPLITRARHRRALEEAAEALARACQAPEAELMAEDIRLATRAIGRITGRVDVEDLLDVIFRDFCIGK